MSFSVPGVTDPGNKFDAMSSWGDVDEGTDMENTLQNMDAENDPKGVTPVPNPNRGEQTNMDMNLAPNMFPRETGHDSLSEEEAQLT